MIVDSDVSAGVLSAAGSEQFLIGLEPGEGVTLLVDSVLEERFPHLLTGRIKLCSFVIVGVGRQASQRGGRRIQPVRIDVPDRQAIVRPRPFESRQQLKRRLVSPSSPLALRRFLRDSDASGSIATPHTDDSVLARSLQREGKESIRCDEWLSSVTRSFLSPRVESIFDAGREKECLVKRREGRKRNETFRR